MSERVLYLADLTTGAVGTDPMILHGIEILRPGEYNKAEFSSEHLTTIATNMGTLAGQKFEAPFVRGHRGMLEKDDYERTDMDTLGWWRNWSMNADGGLEADLEVLDAWTWERIQERKLRYVSAEVVWHTTNPRDASDLGMSIMAVAAVDVPAIRSASLFGEGREPVNLGQYPELAGRPQEGEVETTSEKGDDEIMLEKLRNALGLGADADEEQVLKTATALKDKTDETDTEKPGAKPASPSETVTELPEAAQAQLDAAMEQVAGAQKETASLREQMDAQQAEAHQSRISVGVSALRDEGRIPPSVATGLENLLGGLKPDTVVLLGEGDKAKEVGVADGIITALKDLPILTARIGPNEIGADEQTALKEKVARMGPEEGK